MVGGGRGVVGVFGRGAASVQVISNFVHEIRAQGVLDKAVTIYRGWSKLEKMSYCYNALRG